MSISTIAFCTALLFLASCANERQPTGTCGAGQLAGTYGANRWPSYWEPSYYPSYFRDYPVDWSCGFSDGRAEVEVNGKWGYINSSGQIAIKPEFDEAIPFREGIGIVKSGERSFAPAGDNLFKAVTPWKYIDKNGQVVIDDFQGTYFSEGFAAV